MERFNFYPQNKIDNQSIEQNSDPKEVLRNELLALNNIELQNRMNNLIEENNRDFPLAKSLDEQGFGTAFDVINNRKEEINLILEILKKRREQVAA